MSKSLKLIRRLSDALDSSTNILIYINILQINKLTKFSLLKTLMWKHSVTEKGNTNTHMSQTTVPMKSKLWFESMHLHEALSHNSTLQHKQFTIYQSIKQKSNI